MCFGMAFSNNLTLSGVLPETPSSLGAPLFAELLGGAELAPLLVKFSLGMLLVFFLCALSHAAGGGAVLLKHLGFSSLQFHREGGRLSFRVFGSVMVWMLFLFNPSPTFRVLLHHSSSVLTDGCSFYLPHLQVFAEDRWSPRRFPLWVSFPSPVALVVRLCQSWQCSCPVCSPFPRAAGWFETECLEVLVGLLSLPFMLLVGYFDGVFFLLFPCVLVGFCVAGLFETELHVAFLFMPFSGFLFVSASAVPQCEFRGPFKVKAVGKENGKGTPTSLIA